MPAVRRLTLALIYNTINDRENGDCPADILFRVPEDAEPIPSKSEETATPSSSILSTHFLIPFKCLPGYSGAKQQRCVYSNKATTQCCITCSVSAKYILPLHPSKLARHQRFYTEKDPIAVGKKKREERRSSDPPQSEATRRSLARRNFIDGSDEDSEEEGEEGEEGEEEEEEGEDEEGEESESE